MRIAGPTLLLAAALLLPLTVEAQQASPPAVDDDAGTRGILDRRARPPATKGTTPAKGQPAKGGDTAGSKTSPEHTIPGAKPPSTDGRTQPPGGTKTIMPVPTTPTTPVATPPGQVITPSPPTAIYPPGSLTTGGTPTARPAPQAQQTAAGDVSCTPIPGSGGQLNCVVDRDRDGQPDPGTSVQAYPTTGPYVATFTQVGDFIAVDFEGDGIVDAIIAGTLVQGVPVNGTTDVVNVVVVDPAAPNAPPVTAVDANGDGTPDIVAGTIATGGTSGAYDTNGDGVPDLVYIPVDPNGNRIRVVDLPPPKNGIGPKPQPPGGPVAGGKPPGVGFGLAVVVTPAVVACEQAEADVLPRLDCLKRAFAGGRFGEAEYEQRKANALTLIDPPHMGTEQALRTLNEALRTRLITQQNYSTKVSQVISRL